MKGVIIRLSFLLVMIIGLNACGSDEKNNKEETVTAEYSCPMACEGDKTYSKNVSCPVCKMDLVIVENKIEKVVDENEISSGSIFNLTSKWNTQNSETIELKELKGEVLVVVMVYTSCKAACPRLIADMRGIHQNVENKDVKYILISIDPETDTPERLKAFAIENEMDNDQWVFLQGTIDDVREFSNVLAVKYKQISPIDFSHSNIISVFNPAGELYYQQEGLGVNNEAIVEKINELVQ